MPKPSDSDRRELSKAARDLTAWFEEEGVPGVLIGGFAVGVVARARSTKDVDAMVFLEDDMTPAMRDSLVAKGFDPRTDDAFGFATRHNVLLLTHRETGRSVDLSFGMMPFEREACERGVTHVTSAGRLRVATGEDIVIMKVVAGRAQDWSDVDLIVRLDRKLDRARILDWCGQFAELLEAPERMVRLREILAEYPAGG